MPADNTTNKIKFDIAELKAGIAESNRLIKLANSEFKAAASGMEDWQNSTEGLEAKIKQLNAVQEQEKSKLQALKEQYKIVAAEQGENSAGAVKLATQINNQQAAVNRVTGELKQYEGRLDTVKSAEKEAEKSGRDVADVLKEIDDAANEAESGLDEAEGGFTVLKGAMAELAAGAVKGLISGIKDLAGALFELPEATKEFRTVMAGVEQSASDSVIGIDGAKKAYEEFFKIAADEGQAAEASNHIAGLVNDQKDLQGALDGVIGAWVEYGDSISIEGLAEAANETAKTGVVTGQFADGLNWATATAEQWENALSGNQTALKAFQDATAQGMTAEDAFNEALASCTTEQERQELVVGTLNGLYGENSEAYRENNQSLIDANEANLKLLESQSNLANAVEPLTALMTNLKAQALDALTPAIEWLSEKIQGLVTYFKEHSTAAAALKGVIIGLASAFGVLLGASAISGLISLLPKLKAAFAALNTTMLANPFVLIAAAVAGLVAGFIYLWNTSEGFRNFFIGLWDSIKGAAVAAKDGIVNAFNSVINFFTVTIPNTFKAVLDFFKNNWQTIVLLIVNPFGTVITLLYQKSETFRNIVDKIVTFFKELPGKIWDAIVGAVTKIAEWGEQMRTKAITAAQTLISNYVTFMMQLPGKIWDAIVGAIAKIGEWGSRMRAKAVEAASNVVSSIVNGMAGLPGKMLSIGGDVVRGLWDGIGNKVTWLKNKISGFVGDVTGWLKKFFKIGSPSRLIADEVGQWLPPGVVAGAEKALGKAKKGMLSVGRELVGAMDISKLNVPEISGNGIAFAAGAGGGQVVNNTYNFNQTNNSPTALTRLDIYRQTKRQLQMLKRVK